MEPVFEPEFMKKLACPACKGPVERVADEGVACRSCALLFPFEDGILTMLVDEARPLESGADGAGA